MTFVTVFRRIPKPITGMIGVLHDPQFERFEANLDWLELLFMGVVGVQRDRNRRPR